MTDKPSVLFLCLHNAGRSQMSAGFARALAGDRLEVRSAGSEPAERVNPAAVEAMAEVGIDISGQVPQKLTYEMVDESDVVITMGCGDACPVLPGTTYLDWDLPDPAGKGIEAVRPIRDEIRGRVQALVIELLPAVRRRRRQPRPMPRRARRAGSASRDGPAQGLVRPGRRRGRRRVAQVEQR